MLQIAHRNTNTGISEKRHQSGMQDAHSPFVWTILIFVFASVHSRNHAHRTHKKYHVTNVWRWWLQRPLQIVFWQFQWNSLKDSNACVCLWMCERDETAATGREREKERGKTKIIFLIYLIALLLSLISSLCCLVYEYKYLWFLLAVSKCLCERASVSRSVYMLPLFHCCYHNIRDANVADMLRYFPSSSSSSSSSTSARDCAHALENGATGLILCTSCDVYKMYANEFSHRHSRACVSARSRILSHFRSANIALCGAHYA